MKHQTQALFKHAAIVGVFGAFLYIVCLLWRYTMTDPTVMQFHFLMLKVSFPGFEGYDAASYVVGAGWTFIYFFLGSLAFHWLHGDCVCAKRK